MSSMSLFVDLFDSHTAGNMRRIGHRTSDLEDRSHDLTRKDIFLAACGMDRSDEHGRGHVRRCQRYISTGSLLEKIQHFRILRPASFLFQAKSDGGCRLFDGVLDYVHNTYNSTCPS